MREQSGPAPGAAAGLRVVMIAPTPFFSDRGCHVRILEETRALLRAGAQVTVCTYFLGDTPEGIEVRRTARLPGYGKRSAGPAWGKLALDLMLLTVVRRAVREQNPQVLHAHLHEGIAVASRAGGNAVRILDVQGGLTDETLDHRFLPDRRPVRWTLERIEKALVRRAGRVVTSHGPAARMLTERFGVAPERIQVVGDAATSAPVDEDLVKQYRRRWGLAAGEPVFLYAGLLGEHQGTPHLFPLAERLQRRGSGRILVLGYPEERWKGEAVRRGVEQRMIFAGRFPYAHLASLLRLGTVALSPKTSRTEGNQKLHAYLEAGLPVVAFDTPATAEILGPAGVRVRCGDGAALAEAALAVAADPARLRSLAHASRLRARELGSWDGVVGRLLDAYRRAGARWEAPEAAGRVSKSPGAAGNV